MNSFTLYPKQKEAVDFLLKVKRGLLNYEMGAGKTLTALTAAQRLGLPVTIFAPPFLLRTWEKEITKFSFSFPSLRILRTSKLDLVPLENSIWIIDEFHYFKNITAQRTKNLFKILYIYRPEFVFMLTGSPMLRCGADMYSAFVIGNRQLAYEKYHKYSTFRDTFTHKEALRLGPKIVSRYSGLRNTELLQEMISPFTSVARLADIVPVGEFVDFNHMVGTGREWELRDAYIAFENGRGVSEIKTDSAKAKAAHTIDYALKIYEENQTPILIFSDHVESAKWIAQGLSAPLITGKTPTQDRFSIVENFKLNGNFLVATIGAAGVGLSLENCKDVIFNDISWSHGINAQASSRIRRANSDGPLRRHYVLGGEADAMILEKVVEKEKNTKELFNF